MVALEEIAVAKAKGLELFTHNNADFS